MTFIKGHLIILDYLPPLWQKFVAAVVKGRKSVYRKRRKTRKTCFIYKNSQKTNINIY